MNILFYGFRHGHILSCYREAKNNPNYTIVGALEENAQARKDAEQALGIQLDEGSYQQWLSKAEVEVVAIGGAYGDRGAAIIQALQHGKHVISDKPLCTDLAQLEQIRSLALEKQLKVGCLLDLRYAPQALRARQILHSGRLGAVRNISFTGQHYLDYAHRPRWYFEPGMHGGTINDIAIHGIDLIPFLTGQRISKVHAARTWNAYAADHPHFQDCAIFMAQTEGGAGVLADVSYAAPSLFGQMPTYWNFKIWCEKGLLTFCFNNPDVTVYEDGAQAPDVLSGLAPETSLLDDFRKEIMENTTTFTQSVLSSGQTALWIQQIANSEEARFSL